MPFDRREEDYRTIEILLDERMQGLLDQLWDSKTNSEKWAATIERTPYLDTGLSLSSSEKARLRIATFFWNGTPPLSLLDPRRLDPENRERFIAAYRRHLDLLPSPASRAVSEEDEQDPDGEATSEIVRGERE